MLRTFKNELETNKRLSPKEMWGLHATLRAYQVPCVTNLIDKWYIHRYIDIFYIGLSYLSHAIRFRTLPALEAQHWWMWNQCQNSCTSPQSHHAWAARSSSEASWGKTWLIKIWHYILRRWIDKILHQLVTCIMGFVFDPLVILTPPHYDIYSGWDELSINWCRILSGCYGNGCTEHYWPKHTLCSITTAGLILEVIILSNCPHLPRPNLEHWRNGLEG